MHYFVFLDEKDGLADRLLFWAREAEEPLCSYATGLLAGAMEIQDVAHSHRESNILMVVAFFLLSVLSVRSSLYADVYLC